MVKKLSVNVYVPSVSQDIDFLIPGNMNVGKAISLMAKVISEEYQGMKYIIQELNLINLNDNRVLNTSCNFEQLGIISGSKLVLL